MPRSPEPRFTCTIPSIYDDIPLNIRVYHPDGLSRPGSKDSKHEEESQLKWQRKGVVMAHPYAPMGGSYDDHVVAIVIDEFLRKGWVVGTFNFRGAHGSKGRTSWSGKPELDDYISFAAFFMHYLSYLQPNPPPTAVFAPDQSPGNTEQQGHNPPIVVLGGYSYGSMILRHLPPVPSILQPFSTPLTGSAADEILLRAHKLADQVNLGWINAARATAERGRRQGHEAKLSVIIGGEETSPKNRRSSRDIRRSMDGGSGRRSLNISESLRGLSHRRSPHPQTPEPTSARPAIVMPHVRYLIVSPLAPPISTLATPALGHKFWNRAASSGAAGDVIAKHQSLVVYGDQDQFSSTHKVREWVGRLQSDGASQCSATEIKGAGHFWHDHRAERELRNAIEEWEKIVRL
ncbi:hypothetical protein DM02DRAFT_620147 [Periconia macrospinosa]|uniref:Alpha/beta-hydrolase n=1 Tax=Periconia macrospinosa TaxID=97972 RepID=A0A2V1D275_9PLEO|nr:hypothetical protein DM02DRAFT_620147 [Periconia macrospinosa]